MYFKEPMKLSANSLSVLILSSFLLSACGDNLFLASLLLSPRQDGPSETKSVQTVHPDFSAYQEASCLYKYDQGPAALTMPANTDVAATYFQKKMDLNLLRPVLGASGSEVVRFAESKGVKYFKTSFYQDGTCEFSGALPFAPADINAKYSDTSFGGSILGLFLGANDPQLPTTKDQPVIMVRRDANKWVLVHEYMHFLFNKQAMSEGYNDIDLRARLKSASDGFEKSQKAIEVASGTGKKDAVKAGVGHLKELNLTVIDLMKHYMLEEMTIETMLGQRLGNGEFSYVHKKQQINGAAYILTSNKKAAGFFSSVKMMNLNFQLIHYSEMEQSDYNDLQKYSDQMSALTSEMDQLSNRADRFLRDQGLNFKGLSMNFGLVSTEQSGSTTGCSHSQLPPDVTEVLENLATKSILGF